MAGQSRLQKCVNEVCSDLSVLMRGKKSAAVDTIIQAGETGLKAVLAGPTSLPKNADPRDVWDALSTLTWLIAKHDPQPILDELCHSSQRNSMLVSTLEAAKGPVVVQALIDAMDDASQSVRSAATNALIAHKVESAKPVLIKAILDPSSMVRFSVVDAINKLDVFRDVAALPNLRRLLKYKRLKVQSPGTWQRAQEAVARLEREAHGELVLEASYSSSDVKNRDIAKIVAQLPALQSLDLSETQIGDSGVQHLQELRDLKKLDLCNTRVTKKGVALIVEKLPQLKSLSLGGFSLGNGVPRLISRLASLEELDLGGVICTDDDLTSLASLKSLKTLRLFWRIGDVGLAVLRKLTKLEKLDLYSSQVTDSGLLSLKSMKRLKWLRLMHVRGVTDAGIHFLASCKSLETLIIAGTSISADGVARLRKLLPNCEVDPGMNRTQRQKLRTKVKT